MTAADGDKPLAGKGIVVTRPVHQAGYLAEHIRARGGDALLFPVIAIAPVNDTAPLRSLIERLDEYDIAIFVSPNAVEQAMPIITTARGIPRGLKFAAVGHNSVRALARFGVSNVIAPGRFDSEALLDLPELKKVTGLRVAIFRGVGGRELLRDTLAARGAVIEYAECYRRVQPDIDPRPLLAAWENAQVHAVTVTSSNGLKNMLAMLGAAGRAHLQHTPVFVPHTRIEKAARELGLATVVLTSQGDDGIVQGLVRWFDGRQSLT
jgi:uroporphyrinogen-III synthase